MILDLIIYYVLFHFLKMIMFFTPSFIVDSPGQLEIANDNSRGYDGIMGIPDGNMIKNSWIYQQHDISHGLRNWEHR